MDYEAAKLLDINDNIDKFSTVKVMLKFTTITLNFLNIFYIPTINIILYIQTV